MSRPVVEETPLADRFVLEPDGADRFRAVFVQDYPGAVFGGDLLGRAAYASGGTVDDKPLASLHMRFLRPVATDVATRIAVERIRDGRRLSHRRVTIEQGDKLCCELMLSYARTEAGPEFAGGVDLRGAPEPDSLPSEIDLAEQMGWERAWLSPFEWRWLGDTWLPGPGAAGTYFAWVRPRKPLGAERALQEAAIAYLSDIDSHVPTARMRGGGIYFEGTSVTSLDTVLWLHRDEPWRDWRMLVSDCEVAHGGRALTRRQLYSGDGRLLVSMGQEALLVEPEGVFG